VFRHWFSDVKTIEPPDQVFIPTGEDEKEEEEIPFDAHKIPYSKLLVSLGAVNRGDMTDNSWSALMNPEVTVRDLKAELHKARAGENKTEEKSEKDIVFNGDGILYFRSSGLTVAFAEILYENKDNPLFSLATNRLLQMFGLSPDKELKLDVPDGNTTEVRVLGENGIQIMYRGRSFCELNLDEARDIMASLADVLGELK